jgi:PAS domain S-box-containing protein
MGKSLKKQIILIILLLGAVLILAVRFVVFSGLRSNIEQEIGGPQKETAKNAIQNIDRSINENLQKIKNLSFDLQTALKKEGNAIEINETQILLEVSKFDSATWSEIAIIDLNGKRLFSSEKKLIGTNIRSESEIFQQIIYKANLGDLAVSDVYSDKFGNPIMIISSPIKDSRGDISGAAIGKLNWNQIQLRLPISNNSTFFILNNQGTLIATNKLEDRSGILKDNFSKNAEIQRANAGATIIVADEGLFLKERSLLLYSREEGFEDYSGNNWLLGIEIPATIFFGGTYSAINSAFLLAILFIFIIFAMVIIILIRLVIEPINSLFEFIKKIASGDFSARLIKSSENEIGALGVAVNEMAEKIEGYQRNLEVRIDEKTEELQKTLQTVEEKNSSLENTKKAMLSLLQDINMEKRNIAAQRARTEIILASIGDAVFATDLEGKIIITNDALEKLLGYKREDISGEDFREFLTPLKNNKGDNIDITKEILIKKEPVSILNGFQLISKGGMLIEVSITASPIKDQNEVVFGMIVVAHDMTKERELEKAKDNFLSIAAHQLRTPLGSVRWNLEMLLNDDIEKIGGATKEVLHQIEESNRRMIDLTNNLLDVSRIDQGRVADEPANIEIIKIIKDSFKEVEPTAAKNGISCAVKSQMPEIFAYVDQKKFREVIQNLISNGVKYNIAGGKLDVTVSTKAESIVIDIKDTGIGIPQEEHSQIYGKFFRAKNAILSETEGTGLGLYVVKSYIESWGGKIWFESEKGRGSTFHLTVPLAKK